VGAEACTIFGIIFKKKYKISNEKLGMKLNIYLGPLGKRGALKLILHKLHGKSALCTVFYFLKLRMKVHDE
jgi:hypothetical protein